MSELQVNNNEKAIGALNTALYGAVSHEEGIALIKAHQETFRSALSSRPKDVTADEFWELLGECEDVDVINLLKQYKTGIRII